jgi:hypothetical protein
MKKLWEYDSPSRHDTGEPQRRTNSSKNDVCGNLEQNVSIVRIERRRGYVIKNKQRARL